MSDNKVDANTQNVIEDDEPYSRFTLPVVSGYTIYSKSGCSFCVKAKQLLRGLDPDIVDCDAYLLQDRNGFLQFIRGMTGRDYRTFPMIFLDGKFLGGYTETKADFDRRCSFAEVDF